MINSCIAYCSIDHWNGGNPRPITTLVMSTKKICIVGAGIIGLSCGIRLQETLGRDYQIVIYADKFLEDTTSDVAAGGVRPSTELTIEGYKGKRTNPGQ